MKTRRWWIDPSLWRFYTETGLQDPKKTSPKQRIGSFWADTIATPTGYAARHPASHAGAMQRHSTQPANHHGLSRRAGHKPVVIVPAVFHRQPRAERISQARPAHNPV